MGSYRQMRPFTPKLRTYRLGTFIADPEDDTAQNISLVIKILESAGRTTNLMPTTVTALATLVYFNVREEQRQYGGTFQVHEQHLDAAVEVLEADLKRFK